MDKMNEIKAFVRNTRVDEVVHGLKAIGVKAMTVCSVEGIGALADPAHGVLSIAYVTTYCKMYKLEIVCRSKDANLIVSTIQKLAHTGEGGDGVIFVSPVERAVKIRTGEEGHFFLERSDEKAKDET